MKITFFAAQKDKEMNIAVAMARHCPYDFEVADSKKYLEGYRDYDIACIFGVKGFSNKVVAEGKCIYIDKGYLGRGQYYRVSYNAFHPSHYMCDKELSWDRWLEQGISLYPKVERDGAIIYAGSSQKYCDFHGLGDATEYAKEVIRHIRGYDHDRREIIYRPKPSWKAAVSIEGTTYSDNTEKLSDLLRNKLSLLVTHGSNAAIESLIMGVPAIVLDKKNPISQYCSGTVRELNNPAFPARADFEEFLAQLAYQQWTIDEMANGAMWNYLSGAINEN